MLPVEIDLIAIERFTRLMREQLVSGDVAARRAYLITIIDAIGVSDTTIRIIGSNDNLRAALGPNGQPKPVVRKSVQEWCASQNKSANSYVIETDISNICALIIGLLAGDANDPA